MSALVELQEPRAVWEPPPTEPLDERVWQAWVAKGVAQDRRSKAAVLTAVKWVSMAGLLTAAGLWSQLATNEVAVRFIVAAGAVFVMFREFEGRHFAFAAVFGLLALLYNPIAPVFDFSGEWQRALVILSALPFAASLDWQKVRPAHND